MQCDLLHEIFLSHEGIAARFRREARFMRSICGRRSRAPGQHRPPGRANYAIHKDTEVSSHAAKVLFRQVTEFAQAK